MCCRAGQGRPRGRYRHLQALAHRAGSQRYQWVNTTAIARIPSIFLFHVCVCVLVCLYVSVWIWTSEAICCAAELQDEDSQGKELLRTIAYDSSWNSYNIEAVFFLNIRCALCSIHLMYMVCKVYLLGCAKEELIFTTKSSLNIRIAIECLCTHAYILVLVIAL